MQPRDQVPLDDETVVLGAPDRGARVLIVEENLPVLAGKAQAHETHRTRIHRDRRHHAGDVLRLPQDLVESDLAPLPLHGRDIDLAA